MALSSTAALQGGRTMTEYRLGRDDAPARLTTAQAGAGRLPGAQGTLRELAEIAGVSEAVLRGMVNNGLMEAVQVDLDRPYPPPTPTMTCPTCPMGSRRGGPLHRCGESAHLPALPAGWRDGIGQDRDLFRGRGRSDPLGRQVLVLLPEIALTENFLRRFEARFGVAPSCGTPA
jgi:primosomal protein N' (replication factor Y)